MIEKKRQHHHHHDHHHHYHHGVRLETGSAQLSFYTPIKAPLDKHFQLGITRAPLLSSSTSSSNSHTKKDKKESDSSASTPTPTTTTNSATATNCDGFNNLLINGVNGGGSIVGITDGLNYENNDAANGEQRRGDDQPDSLPFIKPADDDLNVAYSEGTQKTDLLY
uniref:Uncharacterized protein n=1 Tax=Glossina pallidipes TaxID=7398 RepID=A0A1B0A041_GLOPL